MSRLRVEGMVVRVLTWQMQICCTILDDADIDEGLLDIDIPREFAIPHCIFILLCYNFYGI